MVNGGGEFLGAHEIANHGRAGIVRTYRTYARLGEACTLLARTSSSISEIAHATGFYDHSDFIRQFRKCLSQTPGQYRKQSRKA